MVTLCKEEYATMAKNIRMYNMGIIFSRQGVEKSLTGGTSAQFINNYPVPHHEYVQVLCLGWW